MHYLWMLILFPLTLSSFEPKTIIPYPVLGFQEQAFSEDVKRNILIWYPVADSEIGTESTSPWDHFKVAVNAKPAQVIIISHGYTGNPHQLSWLIEGLVHHGYMVLALQHRDLINGKAHINHWQRPLEISKMLDIFSSSALASVADSNNQLKFLFQDDASIDRSWIHLQVIEEASIFFHAM